MPNFFFQSNLNWAINVQYLVCSYMAMSYKSLLKIKLHFALQSFFCWIYHLAVAAAGYKKANPIPFQAICYVGLVIHIGRSSCVYCFVFACNEKRQGRMHTIYITLHNAARFVSLGNKTKFTLKGQAMRQFAIKL